VRNEKSPENLGAIRNPSWRVNRKSQIVNQYGQSQ
jgi:hypothetical protein